MQELDDLEKEEVLVSTEEVDDGVNSETDDEEENMQELDDLEKEEKKTGEVDKGVTSKIKKLNTQIALNELTDGHKFKPNSHSTPTTDENKKS